MKKSEIMYIEPKAGVASLEATIGRVRFSKTGKTLEYDGRRFQSLKGAGYKANYFDVENGEEYWISRCRKERTLCDELPRPSCSQFLANGFFVIDEDAADHLNLCMTGPVHSIAFQAKGLRSRRPAGQTNNGFPFA